MFQMIERKKVKDIIDMSTHAPILEFPSETGNITENTNIPPVVTNITWGFSEERENNKSDAKSFR